MLTILVIIWLIVVIGLILTSIILAFADACAEAAGEETTHPEPEDFK